MPDRSDRSDRSERFAIDAPGADEVAVVAWPLLIRDRVARKVEASDRYRAWVLVAALAGLFSVAFTITILAVSLPTIAADLGTDQATITWVVTGPLLAFGIVGPVLGKAGDIWGQKRLMVLGLLGALVFAGLTAVAWNATSLIVFRVLGAAEGAATGPASMAIIMKSFADEDRVKGAGWWSLVAAGAPVLGVVAGGPVVEHLSWRWIFVGQVPFTLAALVLAVLVLPETERGERRPLDLPGVITLAVGATSLLFALNRATEWGWTSPTVLVAFALAPLGLIAFIGVERRTPHPLLPLDYLRRRNLAAGLGVQFFINFAYMGSFILTPLFLARAFGYGATHVGLVSIARPLSFSLTSPLSGYVAVRVGERAAALAGTVAVAASMVAWTTIDAGSSDLVVMAALALAGVGLGLAAPSMAAVIANEVDDESLGVVGAAQQMVSQVGLVAGIQLAQTVQASRQGSSGLVPSFHEAYLMLGVVCLLGLACALFVRPTAREDVAAGRPATATR